MNPAKMIAALAAVAIAACAADIASAEGVDDSAGSFVLRARAIGVLPDEHATISNVGGNVRITDSYVPELDASYFLTDQIALELIAATSRHGVRAVNTAAGTLNLGSAWVLPPTVTLQWHPFPKAEFSPYVGAGFNYTFFYNVNEPGGPIKHLSYENGAHAALDGGIDIAIAPRWSFNADIKKIFLSTTVNVNYGLAIAKTDINPLVAGIGVGYRF